MCISTSVSSFFFFFYSGGLVVVLVFVSCYPVTKPAHPIDYGVYGRVSRQLLGIYWPTLHPFFIGIYCKVCTGTHRNILD